MPRRNLKELEQEVAAFNARFAVGDEADYLEVVNLSAPQRYRTRAPAQVLSGHTAVVWLVGKSGCVACSHCFMPDGVRDPAIAADKEAGVQRERHEFLLAACREAQTMASRYGWALNKITTEKCDAEQVAREALLGTDGVRVTSPTDRGPGE